MAFREQLEEAPEGLGLSALPDQFEREKKGTTRKSNPSNRLLEEAERGQKQKRRSTLEEDLEAIISGEQELVEQASEHADKSMPDTPQLKLVPDSFKSFKSWIQRKKKEHYA